MNKLWPPLTERQWDKLPERTKKSFNTRWNGILAKVKKLEDEILSLNAENERLGNGINFYIEAGKLLSLEIDGWKENIAEIRTKFLESQRVVGDLTSDLDRVKAENERLKKTLIVYQNPDNWIENEDGENVFAPDVPVSWPWHIVSTGGQ